MRKYVPIAFVRVITFSFCGCEKLKGLRETQPPAPAETVAAASTANPP